MIDVRYASEATRRVVYFCPECEAQCGVPVELIYDLNDRSLMARKRRLSLLAKFNLLHESCGDAELNARLATYLPNFEGRASLIEALYASEPGMPFDKLKQTVADLEEMQKEIDTTPETSYDGS